ncbi:MAG: hypothetical protein ABIT64_04380 [Lysobacteraceae bacterium]
MSRYTKIASRCMPASAAIAVATMLSVASPAFAADAPTTSAPTPQHPATREEVPLTGTHIRKAINPTDLNKVLVYGGAQLRPGDVQWTDDDTSTPALPMTHDQVAVSH